MTGGSFGIDLGMFGTPQNKAQGGEPHWGDPLESGPSLRNVTNLITPVGFSDLRVQVALRVHVLCLPFCNRFQVVGAYRVPGTP